MNSIFHRISVRKFLDKPVEKEKRKPYFEQQCKLRLREISSLGDFMW